VSERVLSDGSRLRLLPRVDSGHQSSQVVVGGGSNYSGAPAATSRATWTCDHSPDQTGGKRCIRCCVARDLQYVSLRSAGGTPARYRWLCPGCLDVYRQIALVDELRVLFTGGHDAAHFGVNP
jgi:hypothetical protein